MTRTRDRRQQPPLSAPFVLSRTFDPNTTALVTKPVGPQVRYTEEERNVNQADATRYHERVIAADNAAPNSGQPTPISTPPSFYSALADTVTFFVTHDPTTQHLSVEVWAKTDMKTGHAALGAGIWVLVQRYENISSYQEYTTQIGQRETFFRVCDSGGTLAANSPTLYATAV